MIPTATVPQSDRSGPSFFEMVYALTFQGPVKARGFWDFRLPLYPLAQLVVHLLRLYAVWARRPLAARTPGRLGPLTPKTIQLHEEYKNSKNAYWSLNFFCYCLLSVGVSRCLGYPSGGL